MNDVRYILGHSDEELLRLEIQSRMLEPLTAQIFDSVELKEGMSVLDIGTGAGDVALLAASRVGPRGRVVGIDRNSAAIQRARSRAAAAGQDNANFEVIDLGHRSEIGNFDLVIGRFVLMHQTDPAGFLRDAALHVQPGGAVAILEMAQTRVSRHSEPPVPSFDKTADDLLVLFEKIKADCNVGSRLVSIFAQAHLPNPILIADTPVGSSASIIPEWIARTAQSVGLASAWSPLADRIRHDTAAVDAQIFGSRNIGGWARI